jgi:hypothetical protein
MKKTILFVLMPYVMGFTGRLHSSDIPEEPILQIEKGMHTSGRLVRSE